MVSQLLNFAVPTFVMLVYFIGLIALVVAHVRGK